MGAIERESVKLGRARMPIPLILYKDAYPTDVVFESQSKPLIIEFLGKESIDMIVEGAGLSPTDNGN